MFGYEAAPNLVLTADALTDSDWSKLNRNNQHEIRAAPRSRPENVMEKIVKQREHLSIRLVEEHVAELDYRPSVCTKEYRMVVVRKLLSHEKGQKLLFPEIRYSFYITNKCEDSAREIVRFSNTRCDQERLIGV